MTSNEESQAHFGFETVSAEEKTRRVHGVFASVANRYDLMNDAMSGGLHRLWKNQFVLEVDARPGERLLDMAGGTGDIAFRLQDRIQRLAEQRQYRGPDARILIADINAPMLSQGRDRAINALRLQRPHAALRWACMNAEALSLPDGSIDRYTIAFGIRNVTRIPTALQEAARVLVPGGGFYCLEFSREVHPAISALYDFYSFKALPALGRWIAQDEDSYRYLAESIRMFPAAEGFADMLRAAGFDKVAYQPLSLGIVTLYKAWKF